MVASGARVSQTRQRRFTKQQQRVLGEVSGDELHVGERGQVGHGRPLPSLGCRAVDLHHVGAPQGLQPPCARVVPGADHDDGDFLKDLNPASLKEVEAAMVEPSLAGAAHGATYQFERTGYFTVDKDTTESELVLNRVVTLRDTWAK